MADEKVAPDVSKSEHFDESGERLNADKANNQTPAPPAKAEGQPQTGPNTGINIPAAGAGSSPEAAVNSLRNPFGKLSDKGFTAKGVSETLKDNFYGEAWRNKTLSTGLKTAGVVGGAGMAADALLRSTTTDEKGNTVQRSWVSRIMEGTAGATIAVGSALSGRR